MSVEIASANHIGPAPDRDEIIRVIGLYVDGFGSHDPGMFRKAFHPSARISFTWFDGHLQTDLILDEIEGWANWETRVTGRILAVVQAGDVATVVLGFDPDDDPVQRWVDVHTLLRIDGTWKIMSKTATDARRADWAADRSLILASS